MTVEEVYTNAFDERLIEWEEVGLSPYLHDTDEDYVWTDTYLRQEGDWSFPASEGSGTINSVKLMVEAGTSATGTLRIYYWNGASYSYVNVSITSSSPAWYEIDVSAILNTWDKINGVKVYVQIRLVTGNMYVRRLTRKVDYTETPAVTYISVAGSVSASGSLLRNKELKVSGSTSGLGSLLRGKSFTVQGLVDALGNVTVVGAVTEIEVLGSVIAQGSVTVNKTILIKGLVTVTGYALVDKPVSVHGLVNALGTIHIGPFIPPIMPPTIPGGFVSRRIAKNLLTTVDGQALLDFKSFMMTLDGQVFINFNGIYVSLDKHILLNINMKKPQYLLIN